MCGKSLQSCPALCDSTDCSQPGSSVHGILQVRILEWVVMSSSRGSSRPRDQTQVSCGSWTAGGFLTAEPQGKPHPKYISTQYSAHRSLLGKNPKCKLKRTCATGAGFAKWGTQLRKNSASYFPFPHLADNLSAISWNVITLHFVNNR